MLIAYADDSAINRCIMEEAAKKIGVDLILGENGQILFDLLMSNLEKNGRRPDIIFSDINMPVMNGLEMIKKIKENEKMKYIPLIVLTTESSLETKIKGKELGIAGWIIKPLEPNEIISIIKKFIKDL